MDRKFFFFRREIESPTSASFSDTGVGVSTIAIPSENLTFITSELGKVRFTFKDCNGFDEAALEEGESLLKTTITVSCRQGEEASLIEEIVNFMSRKTPKNIMWCLVNLHLGRLLLKTLMISFLLFLLLL